MRMRYEAGVEEEFEAACGLLVDKLVRWATEQGLPVDPFMAEAASDYRHRADRRRSARVVGATALDDSLDAVDAAEERYPEAMADPNRLRACRRNSRSC
ncbi:hypothetical protein [Streptomyces blattellae]|uniref:hypothetical protein n=1 Tax=Streptomyces blattellae TaxID=2569855 RepID=UPI001E5CED28|nr:hypothetical protein [Streptomyces blattellae]